MAAPCIHPLLFKQFWTPTCMLQYPWESFNYQKDLWSLPKVFTLPMWFPYILLKWNTGGTLCHVFILQINFVVSKIILRKQRIGSCLTAILYVVLPSISLLSFINVCLISAKSISQLQISHHGSVFVRRIINTPPTHSETTKKRSRLKMHKIGKQ